MTWKTDRQLLLDKIEILYNQIKNAPNRYEAILGILKLYNDLTEIVLKDETLRVMALEIDFDFIEKYCEAMSSLEGIEN